MITRVKVRHYNIAWLQLQGFLVYRMLQSSTSWSSSSYSPLSSVLEPTYISNLIFDSTAAFRIVNSNGAKLVNLHLLWCSYSCGLLVIFSVNSHETRLVKQKLIVSCKLIFLLKYFWDQPVRYVARNYVSSTQQLCAISPMCTHWHSMGPRGSIDFYYLWWQWDTSTQDAKTKGHYSSNTCKLFTFRSLRYSSELSYVSS